MRKEGPTFSDLMRRAGKTPAMLDTEGCGSISLTYRMKRGHKPDRLCLTRYAAALGATVENVEAALERSVGTVGKRGPKAKARKGAA